MEVTFLGTGTSHGIPVLTCDCSVCRSRTAENMRLRSSLLIKSNKTSIVIDTTPEFRIQAIRENIKYIDAVFYTHTHADHLHGIDDLRPYSVRKAIPLYGKPEIITDIINRFSYIFTTTQQKGGGKPQLIPRNIIDPINIGDLKITPIPIKHGVLEIYGYRINDIAYLTDCSEIPKSSYRLLENLDVLIIGALRYREHSTHFNIEQAITEINKISPNKAYFTHICHDVEHFRLIKELKEKAQENTLIKKIKPAHDGLCFYSK